RMSLCLPKLDPTCMMQAVSLVALSIGDESSPSRKHSDDWSPRDMALLTVASAEARLGNVASAQRAAQSISSGVVKRLALKAIVTAQAYRGDLAEARKTFAANALSDIACGQLRRGDRDGARQTMREAAALIQGESRDSLSQYDIENVA